MGVSGGRFHFGVSASEVSTCHRPQCALCTAQGPGSPAHGSLSATLTCAPRKPGPARAPWQLDSPSESTVTERPLRFLAAAR